MKKELKNYRIESDSGEAMVISRERFKSLLQTLEALANNSHSNRDRSGSKRRAVTGD